MKVLDGRNANKVPNIIDIDDFKSLNIVGAYVAPTINGRINIFCIKLNNKFVIMTTTSLPDVNYIFCKSYSRIGMFDKWVKRHYSDARKIDTALI